MGDTGEAFGSLEEMVVQTLGSLGSLGGVKEERAGLWDMSDRSVWLYSGKDRVGFGETGRHDSPLRK